MRHRAEEDALYRQFAKKRQEEEVHITEQIQVRLINFKKIYILLNNSMQHNAKF